MPGDSDEYESDDLAELELAAGLTPDPGDDAGAWEPVPGFGYKAAILAAAVTAVVVALAMLT